MKRKPIKRGRVEALPRRFPYRVIKVGGGFWRLLRWKQLKQSKRHGYVCIAIGNKAELQHIADTMNALPSRTVLFP